MTCIALLFCTRVQAQTWKSQLDSFAHYYKKNDCEKSLFFAKNAREASMRRRPRKNSKSLKKYTTAVFCLAEAFKLCGDYKRSRRAYAEFLELEDSWVSVPHTIYNMALHELAQLCLFDGEYELAKTILLRSKRITEHHYGKQHIKYARNLGSLALIYQLLGDYDQALQLYNEEETVHNQLDSVPIFDLLALSTNRATLYSYLGLNDKALAVSIKVLKEYESLFAKESPSALIPVYSNISQLLANTNDSKSALIYSRKALNMSAELNGSSHPSHFQYLVNYGIACHNNLIKDSAIYYVKNGVIKFEYILGNEHPSILTARGNLGALYYENENFDSLWRCVRTTEHNRKLTISKFFQTMTEHNKVLFMLQERNTRDWNSSMLFSPLRKKPNFQNWLLSEHLLYKSLVLNHSGLVYSRLEKDVSIKNKYSEWLTLKRRLSLEYSKPRINRSKDLRELEFQSQILEGQLIRTSEDFSDLQNIFDFNVKDIQLALHEHTAYIDISAFQYWNKDWTDTIQYIAYIVLPGDTNVKIVRLGNQNDFAKSGQYSLYNSRGIDAFKENIGDQQALSKTLTKLTPYLKDIDTLYFSPSGIFNQVNVAALMLPDGSRLWDHFHVEIKSSVRELLNKDESPPTQRNLLLFGGLQYADTIPPSNDSSECFNLTTEVIQSISEDEKQGTEIGGIWSELDWTGKEVESIQYIANSSGVETELLKDASGSEAAFKILDGQSHHVLHLATHGFFFENPEFSASDRMSISGDFGTPFRMTEDPMMRSGLILSSANRAWQHGCNPYTSEDGILTAREISHLDLSQTELVVLSACQTGLGDIDNSEGVYGLQRAFKMAGVNYIIMSLWSVPDQETSELMIDFYRNWLEKEMSLSEAFYTAQKAMAAEYPKQPELWAGFVLMQ